MSAMKKFAAYLLAMLMVFSFAVITAVAETADEGVDFAAYPETLDAWTINDVQSYLDACGLLGNDTFYLLPMSETDVTPIDAAAGFMYLDIQAASVYVIVYSFDPASEASMAALAGVIENQAIMYQGNPIAIMDAVIGQFAFSYMNGVDDSYIDAFSQALTELAAHFEDAEGYLTEIAE